MIRVNKRTLDAEMFKYDTGSFTIRPKNKKTGEYLINDGDTLYFTLKKTKDKSVVLQKEITTFEDHAAQITIESEDSIDIPEGNYIYDLVVVRADGTTDTYTAMMKTTPYFIIKKGVKEWQ